MAYYPGVCYYPGPVNGRKFDYSEAALRATIPIGTVRKFGQTSWNRDYYYVEGQRVEDLIAAGKRVIGVWTVPDNAMWSSMPDEEWKSMCEQFVRDVPIRSCIIGNEPGGNQAEAYLRKLRIAVDIFKGADVRVQMAAPYPGTERAVWTEAAETGAFGWVDGYAAHPYAANPDESLGKVEKFRAMLNELGAPNKPLHLDECGYSSGVVGFAKQALYLTQMFKNWKANARRLNLGNCFWYILNDWCNSRGQWDHRGVIRPDGSHKPSFAALAAVPK